MWISYGNNLLNMDKIARLNVESYREGLVSEDGMGFRLVAHASLLPDDDWAWLASGARSKMMELLDDVYCALRDGQETFDLDKAKASHDY